MTFKRFILEKLGKLSNAHHHRIKSITHMKDGGIHSVDGKIKSLKNIATYRTKKINHKLQNQELEAAKETIGSIQRIKSNRQLIKIATDNGLNLSKMTHKGLCLNGKHGVTLYRDNKGYYLLKK
jgi:hypothetical protein